MITSEIFSPKLYEYLVEHSTPPASVLQELAAENERRHPDSVIMQISPEQGRFMTLLAQLSHTRDIIEIGTFTGYSSLCLALGIPDDGTILTCDINEEWASMARRYWEKAGVAHKITSRIGPAVDTLRALPRDPMFDMAFIDADKQSYIDYWNEIVPRIRPGGLILADNTLYAGEVIDPTKTSDAVQGIRGFNDHALADERVELVLLSVGDGLTLARKKN
ncbi:caffeoyl-CoA O-methyltransferase [Marinactinospora thermotolerans DSM 45154]|uniref:Caffeoyl-CoA O-methyltransferase n=1 Tax=Marinactinospora thermotolerans DSM 45154 TaxID=1122192 RepID=A0A1T4KJC2_9ACTN|nr:class I SAM-dependent methyltransferase [Marinactinospora thermotolerans]SJZ42532.1 caffeoyl-CoA O-methyltransferase [Marinactinospora thermotolerans DSM 45154]